jgi:hypothetical protein
MENKSTEPPVVPEPAAAAAAVDSPTAENTDTSPLVAVDPTVRIRDNDCSHFC